MDWRKPFFVSALNLYQGWAASVAASVDIFILSTAVYMVLRTAIPFSLHYDKDVTPLFSFNRSFPLRLIAWELTLDYFFVSCLSLSFELSLIHLLLGQYVYHRACHEVDFLWFIHRHHHTTKHPTPILAILAEDYQECLEIVIIPLTASLLVPMSFSELYVTMCYTIVRFLARHLH